MCFTVIISLGLIMEKVSAKTNEMRTKNSVKIGSNLYTFDGNTGNIRWESEDTWESEILVQDSTSAKIVTNGKVLYYSKNNAGKGVIYKMNLNTKKSSKVVSGKGYVLLGGTDKYLYLGVSAGEAITAYKVYIYNMNTKQIKKKNPNSYVRVLEVGNTKVLLGGAHSDVSNVFLEVMSEDGKSIFRDEAIECFIAGKKVIYSKVFFTDDKLVTKYYECGLNGKNKKKIKGKAYEEYKEKYWENIHLIY